jgi:hypothetical protein
MDRECDSGGAAWNRLAGCTRTRKRTRIDGVESTAHEDRRGKVAALVGRKRMGARTGIVVPNPPYTGRKCSIHTTSVK